MHRTSITPKLRTSLVYLLLSLLMIGMMYGRNLSGDVWWHLKTGQWVVQNHALPINDPFSYTARNPITLHEWGSEILLWLAYSITPTALAALAVIMISTAFFIAFKTAFSRSRSLLATFVVIAAGASASAAASEMRPQVFSFVLAAITTLILQQYRDKGTKLIWILPLIMLLWVNLHAIFLIGVGLMLMEAVLSYTTPPKWASKRANPRVAAFAPIFAASLVAIALTLLNPNGITPYTYPFHVLGHGAAMQRTVEWTAPSIYEKTGLSFYILLGMTVFGLIGRWNRPTLRDCIYVAVFALAALKSQRNMVIYAIVAAGPVSLWLSEAVRCLFDRISNPGVERATRRVSWAVLAVLVSSLFIWRVADAGGKTPFDYMNTSEVFPSDACDFVIANNFSGPIYNDYNYGGYLIWRLWPKYKVFVDSRQEPFFNGTYEEDQKIAWDEPQGYWRQVFRKHGIRLAIVNSNAIIADRLLDSADWNCEYADEKAMVFTYHPYKP